MKNRKKMGMIWNIRLFLQVKKAKVKNTALRDVSFVRVMPLRFVREIEIGFPDVSP